MDTIEKMINMDDKESYVLDRLLANYRKAKRLYIYNTVHSHNPNHARENKITMDRIELKIRAYLN